MTSTSFALYTEGVTPARPTPPCSRNDRVAERFESGPSHAIVAALTPARASQEIKRVAVRNDVELLGFPDVIGTHRRPRIPEAT